ncbi:MAG: YHS domain-containing protein [Pseudomonadales bacterium]|nr:YHS domain-containing protein [Pseudomonadales bacterium]
MLDLPQANVSQHLQILRDAGIVVQQKNGKQVFYKLGEKKFVKINDLSRAIIFDKFSNQIDSDKFIYNMKDLVPLTHDPVCKMRVSPKTAGFRYKYMNIIYYFCASGCLEKFKKKPLKYVGQ